MRSTLVTLMCVIAAGCGSDERGLRVSGETGYVRCLAAEVPAREWTVGRVRLRLDEERHLRIEGLPREAHVAFVRGPLTAETARALDVDLAVVVGGIAASRAEADASLASLAAIEAPVLVIAGGADRRDALTAAIDALSDAGKDRVVDATPIRSVRAGAIELVPLGGAPEGRYASSNEACGFSSDDLDDVADALGAPEQGVKRYLVSWAAPRGEGTSSASHGVGGVEAGSASLREFATRIGAVGEVFAWPVESTTAIERDPLRVAVGPLAGAWVERADGTRRAPGATVLTLGPDGLGAPADSP